MTVTITAYKRPELLRRCLESVWRAQRARVNCVLVAADYHTSETVLEVRKIVTEFARKLPIRLEQADSRFGIANNTRRAYGLAFQMDYEVCAIEEDTEISADGFEFAYEMLQESGYRFVNLCSHQTPTGSDPAKVHEDNELRGGYGWALPRTTWNYLEPRWNGKIRSPYGWDWAVGFLANREKWKVLTPEVSRVFNTGREGGTYDTPENYDKRVQRVCEVVPERYEIVKHELDYTQPEWVQAEMR